MANPEKPDDTVGGAPPKPIQDLLNDLAAGFGTGAARSFILDSMITALVSTAVRRLPTAKKVQAIMFLAELVWPGSVKKTDVPDPEKTS